MRMIVSDIPDPKKWNQKEQEFILLAGSASALNDFGLKNSTKNRYWT